MKKIETKQKIAVETTDLVICTEGILNGKLYCL